MLVAHDKFGIGDQKVIEVIDLDNPDIKCKSFDLLEDCSVPLVGGQVRSSPLLCCVSLCYYLSTDAEGSVVRHTEVPLTLNEPRVRAATSSSPYPGQWMLISGGYRGSYQLLNSTEILTDNGWIPGVKHFAHYDLPFLKARISDLNCLFRLLRLL